MVVCHISSRGRLLSARRTPIVTAFLFEHGVVLRRGWWVPHVRIFVFARGWLVLLQMPLRWRVILGVILILIMALILEVLLDLFRYVMMLEGL